MLRDPRVLCCPTDGSGWPSQDRAGEGDRFSAAGIPIETREQERGWDLAQICYKLGLQLDLRKI